MTDFPTIADHVGNTPLVRLQRLAGQTSNTLLVKLEGKLSAAETAARELSARLDAHTERCEKCRKWRENRVVSEAVKKN